MDYKDYQHTRNAVWKLLIDTGADVLPIPVISLCTQAGIEVRYDALLSGSRNSGYTTVAADKPFILIDPEISADLLIIRQYNYTALLISSVFRRLLSLVVIYSA